MSRTAYAIPLSCLVLALTWVLVQAPTVRADDDLRDEIRALNTILGDEDQADRVKELAKDPELARKMLALAKKMADDQPDRPGQRVRLR
ncbi:MAG TPA: hypothetical protein PKC45_01360, partial [Gemmatales bacterium]|nr:hypothetical protein [Gemmatales bacterium]